MLPAEEQCEISEWLAAVTNPENDNFVIEATPDVSAAELVMLGAVCVRFLRERGWRVIVPRARVTEFLAAPCVVRRCREICTHAPNIGRS